MGHIQTGHMDLLTLQTLLRLCQEFRFCDLTFYNQLIGCQKGIQPRFFLFIFVYICIISGRKTQKEGY